MNTPNLKLFSFVFFMLVVASHSPTIAQGLPPIANYSPLDYKGENQNWSIAQGSNNRIYIANNKGLLEFNGATWIINPSPNESIMRSVEVVGNRIYTGCFMEFGFWQRNNFGTLDYTSISQELNVALVEDEEFWNILALENLIVFQSLKRIYIYNTTNFSVTVIDSNSTISKMFKVDQTIYFQRKGQGVFKLDYGKPYLVFDDALFNNDEVINIFYQDQRLLILTQNEGFYSFKDGNLVKSDFTVNSLLEKFSIYDGIRLKDNRFVLGTIANGVIFLNPQGEFQYQLNQNNGLSNNTVLSLFEDVEQNIWLGLDKGISYINTNAPYTVFTDNLGILGSVYTAILFKENLYLGTNQGLFFKNINGSDAFKLMRGTQGQVWSLRLIDDTLFCGHNSGTFIIKESEAIKITNVQGTWDIAKMEKFPGLLLQGNYDGLYILEKSKNSWELRNKLEGFENSSRYFETYQNKIFVNHEYNGVFEMDVDSSFKVARNLKIDTTIKGANSGIIKYKNELLYAYKKGILKYIADTGVFVKDSLYSQVYTDENYESGKLILTDNENVLWFFTKHNITFVSRNQLTNDAKINIVPLKKESRSGILGYESITKLNKSEYLIGTTSGYIIFDIDNLRIKDFEVFISQVTNRTHNGAESLQEKDVIGDFTSENNTISIAYFTPEYFKLMKPEYQIQLGGDRTTWSPWSDNYTTTFENLSYGMYTFKVRSRIGNMMSSNTATYSFSIAKPWYISNIMIALYVLGVLLFSLMMHTLYRRYYKRQREKLILKNKRELKFAKVESEREIMKIKNERLEVEFKSKSKELAASTMNIIKKNELFSNIKEELNKIGAKETLKPVIKIIDSNLNQNNEWELFQEAFDNADIGFLKRVKALHPKLSPNDLKLCAYLRLNLSSKDIAQILNISPRSVEIKRYRLRKKLKLQHEDNLVNYLLEI